MLNEEEFVGRYTCLFCLSISVDAVETECCGKFFCNECYEQILKKYKRCPQKCTAQFRAHISINARRDIKNTTFPCIKGCGFKFCVNEKQKHEESCEFEKNVFETKEKMQKWINNVCQLWRNLKYSKKIEETGLISVLQRAIYTFSMQVIRKLGKDYYKWIRERAQNSENILLSFAIVHRRYDTKYKLQHYLHLSNEQNLSNPTYWFVIDSLQELGNCKNASQAKQIIQHLLENIINHSPNSIDRSIVSKKLCLYLTKLIVAYKLSLMLQQQQNMDKCILLISKQDHYVKLQCNFLIQKVVQLAFQLSNSQNKNKQIQSKIQSLINFNLEMVYYLLKIIGEQNTMIKMFQMNFNELTNKNSFRIIDKEQMILQIIITALENELGSQNYMVDIIGCETRRASQFRRNSLLFMLNVYVSCHKKYIIKICQENQNIIDIYEIMMRHILQVLTLLGYRNHFSKNGQMLNLNWKKLGKEDRLGLDNKQFQESLQLIVFKIGQYYSSLLNMVLLCIEEENINFYLEFQIRYQIYYRLLDLFLVSSHRKIVKLIELVFYSVKMKPHKSISREIATFFTSITKNKTKKADIYPFFEQAKENILDQNIFSQVKDSPRALLYKQQKIDIIFDNFYDCLLKKDMDGTINGQRQIVTVKVDEKNNKKPVDSKSGKKIQKNVQPIQDKSLPKQKNNEKTNNSMPKKN